MLTRHNYTLAQVNKKLQNYDRPNHYCTHANVFPAGYNRLSHRVLLCFAVLILAAFTCAQAEGPTDYNHDQDNNSFDKNTICYWDCTVISSDFPVQTKTDIVTNTLITLVVNYETNVDEKCVNRASQISSNNAIKHFKLWLPAINTHYTLNHAIERALDLIFQFPRYAKQNTEIKAVCSL